MYMAAGAIRHRLSGRISFFHSGQPFTHGGDGQVPTWGRNTEIRRVSYRMDGFAGLYGQYSFADGGKPYFRTHNLTLPSLEACSRQVSDRQMKIDIELHINAKTSVVGYVAVGLVNATDEKPLPGFAVSDANPITGDFISRPVSWGANEGKAYRSLLQFAGLTIQMHTQFPDSILYAIQFVCTMNQM